MAPPPKHFKKMFEKITQNVDDSVRKQQGSLQNFFSTPKNKVIVVTYY